MRMQTMLRTVYPPECLSCGEMVDQEFALCPSCWEQTPFILGASCELCGGELPGQTEGADGLRCDDCRTIARPWDKGRAVMSYSGIARRLVLALKHGDRADIARAAGPWLARAAASVMDTTTVIVPVPLFRSRLWRRRYNQSALLAQALARQTGAETQLDALIRGLSTPSLDGKSRSDRFQILDGAIAARPGLDLSGRSALLIDDVMTTGATLAASTAALFQANAEKVSVLVLARVSKDT